MKVKELIRILRESNPEKSVFILLRTPQEEREYPIEVVGEIGGAIQIRTSLEEG